LEGKAKAWVHAGSAFQPSHPNSDAAAAPLSSTRHLDMQLQSLQMDLELQVRRNRLNEEEVTQLQDENRDLYDKLAKSQAESYRHEVASKLAMEKVKALTAAAVRAADDPSGQSDQPSYRGEQGLNQVQAFNRRLVQEMEALKTKRDILQRQLGQAGKERESLLAGQTELEDRLKQSASAREVLEARVAKLEGALQAAHAAAGGDTAVSLPTLLEENTLLIAENMKLSAEVTSVATQLELLQSEQQDLEPLLARLQDQEAKISELEDEVIHVKSMHARHQKRSASLEDERDFLKTTEQEFQQELEQLQNMLSRSQEHCAALEEELGAVRQDNERLLGDLQSAQDALAMLQEELCHTQKAQDLTAAEAHALEKLHKADSMVLKRESHLVAEERDRALAETARLRKEQNEMKARLEAATHPHAAPESKDSGAPERPRVAAAEAQSLRSTVLHRAPDGPSRRDTGSSPLPPALADGSSPFAGGSDPIGISTSDAPPGLQVAYLELQRESHRPTDHLSEDQRYQLVS
jgi:chromosome segregation ATPase